MRTALIIAVSILLFSCKNSSQAMDSTKPVPDTTKPTNLTKGDTNQEVVIYDMIISFISKASGIDQELKAKVDARIALFNKENKTDIQPEIVGWGREGEKDYNFVLKNLSTEVHKKFVAAMEQEVKSTDMANITFNQPSVHKR